MHVLVVSDSGTEFVGLSCINCHRSDICFKDEADAALKTGVWADYETFIDKAISWDSYVGADGNHTSLNLSSRMLVHVAV